MDAKKLYLTFDDGPSAVYTPKLLELLDEEGVKATFFTLGESVNSNPELIRQMQGAGHSIQVHAGKHISAYLRTRRNFSVDLEEAIASLRKLGVKPYLYRAPWGHVNWFSEKVANNNGLQMVRWDVMADDWKGQTTPEIIRDKILDGVFPGAVICLHDGRGSNGAPSRTIAALRMAIPELKERGYTFETM